MRLRSLATGCGAYLPQRVVTNAELSKTVETSDEWIRQRTGIRERRFAADGELTSTMATRAPASTRAEAMLNPRPMGLPAPVTMATLPSRGLSGMNYLSGMCRLIGRPASI